MPITLPVSVTADDRAFKRIADRYEKWGKETGGKVGAEFTKGMGDAFDSGSKQADKFERAYGKVADTMGKVRVEEAKLQDLRAKGASDTRIITQAEALERARRAEARATKEAANAFREYEQAAGSAGKTGSRNFLEGIVEGMTGIKGIGADAGDGFAGGFGGAGALRGMGGAVLKAGGWIAAAVTAGKMFADGFSQGLATLQMQDLFQGKMGLDSASMAQFAQAAGKAYADNWGQSVADNLETAKAALQSGLIDPAATGAEVQSVIEQLQGLNTVTDASSKELSRSITTLMRTGLAGSVSEASDIIVAGFQKGLDVSGDWLDTINEYSTQFRKLGLSADEVLTLMKQGLEGGARDTDKVADSLKEFSIRAVDGSKSTREGFEALGFNADEMADRVAKGGATAKDAFGRVLDAINRISDPLQQALIWQRLFGTQWEDLGNAVSKLNLDPAKNQFTDLQDTASRSTKEATDNFASEWDSAMKTVEQRLTDFKTWMADWITSLPIVRDLPEYIKAMFGDPSAAAGSSSTYSGQVITPVTPSTGGGINPGGGLITGNGTFLDSVLSGGAGAPAPPGLIGPGAGTAPQAPTQGAPVPILTDAEEQAKKDAEKSAKGAAKNIPLSQYSLDAIPFGQFQGEGGIQLPGRKIEQPHTGPGYYEVDPQRQFDAETQQISARNRLEDARRRVLEVQADNDHTEAELQDAKNALLLAERGWVKAQQDVIDAQTGTWKKVQDTSKKFSDGMGDISAQLDNDFGISQGLPGIAENIVKFLGALAFAPVVGALKGVQSGLGFPNGAAGSGVAGMIGSALGMATPRDQRGVTSAAGATSSTVSATGYESMPNTSVMPSILRDTGSVPSGAQSRAAAALIQQHWGSQLRGQIGGSRDNNTAKGTHDAGLSIDIPIGQDQKALGDEIENYLQANASQLGLKYTIWRDKGKYPGGGGFDQSGHQDHIDAHFNGQQMPGGALSAPGGLGGYSSGGATPVFVVNMPGGGGFGGSGLGGAAPSAARPGGASGVDWDKIAQLESSGNWSNADTGKNGHYGGLQFSPETWRMFGGTGMPQDATPEQQKAIANNVLYGTPSVPGQGSAAWETWPQSGMAPVPAGGRGMPHLAGQGTPGAGAGPLPGPAGGGIGTGAGFPGLGSPPSSLPSSLPGGAGFTGPSSVQGGRELGQGTPASGGIGFSGGLIGLAGSAATSAIGAAGLAADASGAMGGGSAGAAIAAAAAQIGIDEGMRAIAYAGQLAGIGVGGLLETFSLNDSALADPGNSWLGKIAMGVAGARPALPNTAGAKGGEQNQDMAESGDGKQPPGPMDPTKLENGGQGGSGGAGSEGTSGTGDKSITNNTTINYQAAPTDNSAPQTISRHVDSALMTGVQ